MSQQNEFVMQRSNTEREKYKTDLLNSLLHFTQIFYYLRYKRKFELSTPPGRESHYITICRELVKVFDGKVKRLIINVPPRYGKSELLMNFVAWSLAHFSDSNYIYTSYSHSLATRQTQTIRNMIQMPEYRDYFNVQIRDDASAKDDFSTTAGGTIYAAGSGGSITGRGAGIQNCNRFSGAIIIDDIIKPDEALSDSIRESTNEWFYNTLQSRTNSPNTPIIYIGQRVHEDDLAAHLIKTGEWETIVLPVIDVAGNPLHPAMHDLPTLKKMKELSPYNFAAQYQQDPQPAGGGIFKEDWFVPLDMEPEIISTFITVDTAETSKTYNDPTVFSFWGLYKLSHAEMSIDEYALHWIDCLEVWIEPKDLKHEFLQFYTSCMRHTVKPKTLAIEKKSTGVTLLSTIKEYRGLHVIDIERTRESGSKTARFLEAQPYVAQGLISLPQYGKHTTKCIQHCKKITANDSHRYDDIADTMYDAIKLGLIDKVIIHREASKQDYGAVAKQIMGTANKIDQLRKAAYGK